MRRDLTKDGGQPEEQEWPYVFTGPLSGTTAWPVPYLFDLNDAKRLLDLVRSLPDRPRAPPRALVYETVFSLLYGLGMRAGEVARLKLGDVDSVRETLFISETKFSKSRIVPLGPRLPRVSFATLNNVTAKSVNPRHPQYIPHTRLTSTDIRFDGRLIADLLSRTQDANLGMGSAVLEGGKLTRSRHRDRKGLLIKRGRGRKFWLSQWPEGNKRRSLKLGWCDEMTPSRAERAHRQQIEKVNRQRESVGDSVTLDGFFGKHYWHQETEQYLDKLNTKKPSTRRDMKNVIRQILIPRWGKRSMGSIRAGEIQSFFAAMIGEGRARSAGKRRSSGRIT